MAKKLTERERASRRADVLRRFRTQKRRLKLDIRRLQQQAAEEEKARNGRAARRLSEFVAAYKQIEAGQAGSALADPKMSVALAIIDERAHAALEAYRAIVGRLVIGVMEGK